MPGEGKLALFTGLKYEALPSRVREAIQRQQESSEVLIGWVQLAIVTTFAVLYFIFTVVAIYGYFKWRRALGATSKWTHSK